MRGVAISLENALFYGPLSLVCFVFLLTAFKNLSRTTFQEYSAGSLGLTGRLYKREAHLVKRTSFSRGRAGQPPEVVMQLLADSAFHYSLAVNSTLYLGAFLILAATLLANLPSFPYSPSPWISGIHACP